MSVQSVQRAISLMLAAAERPAGLVDLAERTQLPTSTAARLLETLVETGVLQRHRDGVYERGPSLAQAAGHAVDAISIQALAQGPLARLADELGEAVSLSLPLGDEVVTILQLDRPRAVQAQDWTGRRWPMTSGGSGIVMMPTWDDRAVDRLLEPAPRAATRHSETDRRELRRQIAAAREHGVSWTTDGLVEGLTSVAAPLRGPDGRAIAAIVAYGPTFRFPGTHAVEAADSVRRTALAIDERITEATGGTR